MLSMKMRGTANATVAEESTTAKSPYFEIGLASRHTLSQAVLVRACTR
jgi:hypothetical protein